MKNNKKFTILIIVLCLQLLAPFLSYFITYSTLKDAPLYKVSISAFDPYDVLNGRYLAINPQFQLVGDLNLGFYPNYAIIDQDQNGYLTSIKYTEDVPDTDNYIPFYKMTRYYIDGNNADAIDAYVANHPDENYYVTAKINKGKFKILNLYVNDIPIDEVVK